MPRYPKIFLYLLVLVPAWVSCRTAAVTAGGGAPALPAEPVREGPCEKYYGLPPEVPDTPAVDILHTALQVRFDWLRQEMPARAELTLVPLRDSLTEFVLDAKGFRLDSVALAEPGSSPLAWQYKDNRHLVIRTGWFPGRHDTLRLVIRYTARPEALDSLGIISRHDQKGLYFINPLGKDAWLPRQVWTQNETTSASCWFPTVDIPSERFTWSVDMTVDTGMVTLSNGLLVRSTETGNGLRTDHWEMNRPLPPYLVMMAAGPFAVVSDRWRGIGVSYYVDPDYAPWARHIFGNTPEMLEYFSTLLGVPYPWPKYSQAVVHNFVSGAMENTSATVHFSGLQQTPREMIDGNMEDFISHELFHQWFGDLVTCARWSQIVLNEGFATYGEYLWLEHHLSREEADLHLATDLSSYLNLADMNQYPLVRARYNDPDDLFDVHTYQKGGLVLHMLRTYLGDSLFFAGLHEYLVSRFQQPVTWHDLASAMETVSGQDLGWFFEQWFLRPGHPVVSIRVWQEADSTWVKLTQHSSCGDDFIYRLPLDVDVYYPGRVERHRLVFDRAGQEWVFPGRPLLVNVDAQKAMLWQKDEDKPVEYWLFQLRNGPLYADRAEALRVLAARTRCAECSRAVRQAVHDPFHGIRLLALEKYHWFTATPRQDLALLRSLAWSDPDPAVRNRALALLVSADTGKNDYIYRHILREDSSLSVLSNALLALYTDDSAVALLFALQLEDEAEGELAQSIGFVYSRQAGPKQNAYFLEKLKTLDGWGILSLAEYYHNYLERLNRPTLSLAGVDSVFSLYSSTDDWIRQTACERFLEGLVRFYDKQAVQSGPEAKRAEARAIADRIRALFPPDKF